jgi:hypothetical protein
LALRRARCDFLLRKAEVGDNIGDKTEVGDNIGDDIVSVDFLETIVVL